jgi:DNA-binding Lrp family transcriptional regulator
MRQEEFTLELDTNRPYKNFQERINVHKEELTSLLKKLKRDGKEDSYLWRIDQRQHDLTTVWH